MDIVDHESGGNDLPGKETKGFKLPKSTYDWHVDNDLIIGHVLGWVALFLHCDWKMEDVILGGSVYLQLREVLRTCFHPPAETLDAIMGDFTIVCALTNCFMSNFEDARVVFMNIKVGLRKLQYRVNAARRERQRIVLDAYKAEALFKIAESYLSPVGVRFREKTNWDE